MRKSIGIITYILGLIQSLTGLGISLFAYFKGIDLIGLSSVFEIIALIITVFLLLGGIWNIIVGCLASSKNLKDKTIATWAIIVGSVFNWITMFLGIALMSGLNKPAAIKQESAPISIDAEIESIKKQIELTKFKKELEKLNNE